MHSVAGEGFEPSKLSRWIYRPPYADRSPALSRLAGGLHHKFATDSRRRPTAFEHTWTIRRHDRPVRHFAQNRPRPVGRLATARVRHAVPDRTVAATR